MSSPAKNGTSTRKKIVVALGGNALLRRGEPLTADIQRVHAGEAMTEIAELARHHDVILTHGNGPQVGLLALQGLAYTEVPPYPLDVLGAESEGMIGYVLEQELENRLPGRNVVTVLTQMIVDASDPAFQAPSKPIGPVYSEDQARRLAVERSWSVAADNSHFRRVVASPQPVRIVELAAIRTLVDSGALVVCSGGGGIPVTLDEQGALHGIEAVIDKDLAAELLARSLNADFLLMLTDVEAVMDGYGGPDPHPIRRTSPGALRGKEFAVGSMGPKVEAACRFVEATGHTAAIGSLNDAVAILAGNAGTTISANGET